MKKNGFTLIELTAVIVLLGLIMTVVISSSINMSSKVKENAYLNKIDVIETAAKDYGVDNSIDLKKSMDKCGFSDNEKHSLMYNEAGLEDYPCIEISLIDLIIAGYLDADSKTDGCNDVSCYTIEDPVTNEDIKDCKVYIYYRNKRVYAKFDKDKCDKNE